MARLEELFERALDLSASERESFLARVCSGDALLKAAVQRLLASDEVAENQTFWQGSALDAEVKLGPLSHPSRVGQILGDYRIVEMVGEGGMGAVYRAVRADAEYEQAVAIKLVRGGFDSVALAERFRQERQILANLNHPNIARLLDGGTTPDGLPYLVMEFIAGQPLTTYCDERKLVVADRVRLFRQACNAVEFAHQRLVIHRDLKPSNILVNEAGEVKLLDFGVAKLVVSDVTLQAQQTVGMNWLTPGYASPEQISGEPMTTASDVYSLGVILYELLCGSSPYRGKLTLADAMRAVREEEPLPPSEAVLRTGGEKTHARKLKGDLDHIVLKALRKEPGRRYASVEQLSEDLRRYLEGLPVLAQGDSVGYRAAKFVRRNAIAVAAVAAVFVTLVVGIVMTLRAEARARRQFNEVRRLAHTVLFDYHDAIASLPGSTPVRQKLVKDALSYLDGLSQLKQDEGLEREIALAYVKVADVQGNSYNPNLGDTAGGMESARKAVSHAEPLYKKNPSANNAYVLGRAYLVLAIVIHSSDQVAGAEDYYKHAVAMFDKAVTARGDEDWQTRRIEAVAHLGDLYGLEGYDNLGRTGDALVAYTQARDMAAQLVRKDPKARDPQEDLFLMQLSVAGTAHQLGHAKAAEDGYRDAIEMNERMVGDGEASPSDRQNLATAYFELANQLLDNGKPQEAVPYMQRSRDLVQQIAESDPKNALFQRSLAVKQLGLCRATQMAGKAVQAAPLCRQGVASLQTLSTADPRSGDKRLALANGLRELGEAQLAARDAGAALVEERRALAMLHDMPEGTHDATAQLYTVRAQITAGEAELWLGGKQAAIADFQIAANVANALVGGDPDQAYHRLDRARAKTQLAQALASYGQCSQAEPIFTQSIQEWKALREMGILPPAELGRAEFLEAALGKCQPKTDH